jgi:endoglucanase
MRYLVAAVTWLVVSAAGHAADDVGTRERQAEYGATAASHGDVLVQVQSSRAFTIAGPADQLADCCTAAQVLLSGGARTAAPPRISTVGVEQQVTGFRDWRNPKPLLERRIHLLLDAPLQTGSSYTVRLEGVASPVTLGLTFNPMAHSPAIQVNQLGFHPGQRKLAYVGGWLGTAGPLPVQASGFEVVSPDGVVRFNGSLELRAGADPASGNDVWEADFSGLVRQGRYLVRVPGIGVSDPFEIDAGVYGPAYRQVMRVFYHSRNSTVIEAPWATGGFERSSGIRPDLDGLFDLTVGSSPLGRGERPGTRHLTRRGWFDAGDYGQYVVNAAPVWFAVALGMELDPGAFKDGDLDIPESGNGLPDALDELEWGFDWALSMQDDADGGVYFRVASQRWDDSLPQFVTQPRLVAEKTTHATASFAAIAAIHARLLAEARPARSAQARAAAERAWQFMDSKPSWPAEGDRYRNRAGVSAGEYADPSSLDNRLWAAAELFRLTAEERYLRFYEANFSRVPLDPTGEVTYSQQAMAAAWAYLRTDDPRRDPGLVEAARRALIAGADWRIRQMEAQPYRVPLHPDRGLVGWGTFGHSARAVLSLAQAYALTGKDSYRMWAWDCPAAEFGANPLGLSFITGLGARSPRYPLSKLSQFNGDGSPLPGLPVYGPHANLPGTWPTTRAVNGGYLPAASRDGGYPVLRRYTDARHLPPMSEPTVAEIARIGVSLALLRDGGPMSPPAAAPTNQQ